MRNWLFPFPQGYLRENAPIVARQVQEDPVAAAIDAGEAERFAVVVIGLDSCDANFFRLVARYTHVEAAYNPPKARRHGAVLILRQWRRPSVRAFLEKMPLLLCFGDLKWDPADPGKPSLDKLADLCADNMPLPWVLQFLRETGREHEIEPLMEMFGEFGSTLREYWANLGRLMLRRFVLNDPAAAARESRRQQAGKRETERRLKRKHAQARSLSLDKEQMQNRQRELKQMLRRTRSEAEALLAEARAEVAAAQQALEERREAQARELAEQAERHLARMAELRERQTAGRAQFAAGLEAWRKTAAAAPLSGKTVTVTGDDRNQEGYRLLVESVGGRLLPEGGEIQVRMGQAGNAPAGGFQTIGKGLAAFELVLWRQVLLTLFPPA